MPSTYTTNLGIELPADGELDGVWGDVVNENMDILDRAINGSIALSLSGTTSTLTTSDGALSDGQYKLLVLGGSPSGTHTITIAPSDAQKIYFVRNTTAQSVVFTQGSGGNVTVATGDSAIIYSDGAGAGAAVVNITNDFAMSSVKITGGTIDGTVIGGTSAAAVTGTTITGTSFVSSGDMTFGDSDKAIFGAGSDLQIYHDGTNSYIKENNGTGHLVVNATNLYLRNSANSSDYLSAVDGGAVTLKYNGISTIATTATGVAVTGDVGATTGTFSGDVTIADKIVHSGDTNTAIRFPAADTVTVETSGAERLRVDSSGNVGIGTSTISSKLTVDTGGTTTAGYIDINSGGLGRMRLGYAFTGGPTSSAYAEILTDTSGNLNLSSRGNNASNLQFYTSAGASPAERMRITSAGNVGIGTTSPSDNLTVVPSVNNKGITIDYSAGSARLTLTGNAASAQAITFGDSSSATSGQLIYDNSVDAMRINTNGSERMRIDSAGNVGIGTAAPSVRFHAVSGVNNTDVARFTGGQINRGLTISTYLSGGINDGGVTLSADDSLRINTNASERMRIDSSGNVGIGTTSPASKLNVVGGQIVVANGSGTSGLGLQIKDLITALPAAQVQGYIGTGDSTVGIAGDLLIAPRTTAAASVRFITGTTPAERLSIGGTGVIDIKSDGTAAAPSLVFGADADTGLFRPATNTLAVSTAGTERMRIDSSGNVGIGTSSPGQRLQVQGAAFADTVIRISTASGTTGNFKRLEFTDNAGGTVTGSITSFGSAQGAGNDSDMAFAVNGSERMRIDASGNVGIGLTAPTDPLHITRDISAALQSSVRLNAAYTAGGLSHGVGFSINSNAVSAGVYVTENNGPGASLLFTTSPSFSTPTNTERMRLDSSGNLGLGVTPSAWGSSVKVAQVSNASIAGQSNQALFSNNAFFDGAGWKYISSAVASQYYLDSNARHQWLTAPSGTAGNAITFTQAMTLDASGNLGIGTTSPAVKLHVAGSLPFQRIDNSAATSGEYGLRLTAGATDLVAFTYSSTTGENRIGGLQSYVFPTFYSGGSERARIDSSGNLLVGTTVQNGRVTIRGSAASSKPLGLDSNASYAEIQSYDNGPLYLNRQGNDVIVNSGGGNLLVGTTSQYGSQKLSLNGGIAIDGRSAATPGLSEKGDNNTGVFWPAADALGFSTGGTERARIDASGNLLVGRTTNDATVTGCTFGPTGGGITGTVSTGTNEIFVFNNTATGGTAKVAFRTANVEKGSIAWTNASTAYNTSSDYRLKENVAPMQNALDTVAQLNPVTYTWKADGSAGQGFIAHELQAVVPDCVTGEKDAVDADGNPQYQGVDTSFLVATLVKAIQELKAEVDSLRAQLNP